MNVSNDLILFRMVLFPIFLVDLICDRMQLAFAFLPLAGATDVLDVFPVRLFKQHTLLGPYLGLLADKLLMIVSYASLAIIWALAAWLAVIVTTKDLFVSIGVAIMYFSGQVVEAALAFLGENRPLFFRSSLLRWP